SPTTTSGRSGARSRASWPPSTRHPDPAVPRAAAPRALSEARGCTRFDAGPPDLGLDSTRGGIARIRGLVYPIEDCPAARSGMSAMNSPFPPSGVKVLTVGELTRAIKGTLEEGYASVWVEGEVSNLARPSSGHL